MYNGIWLLITFVCLQVQHVYHCLCLSSMVIRGFHSHCIMSFHCICCLGSIYVILKTML